MFTKPDNNRNIWRQKPNILQNQSSTVKADWDTLLNTSADDLITVIDELEASTGAASLGAEKSGTPITVQDHIDSTSNPHSVTKTQIGLSNVTNDKQATETAFNAHTGNTSNPHSVTAAQVDAVPTTRTVNGKALSSDISLDADDVSALPISGGTLTGSLVLASAPTTDMEAATKKYADDLAIAAGAVTSVFGRAANVTAESGDYTGGLIPLTGYSKPEESSAVADTDTVNEAIGKLEKAFDGKANSTHASQHASVGTDPISPSDIGAQPTLTFDDAPTQDSTNPVTSDGIFAALNGFAKIATGSYVGDGTYGNANHKSLNVGIAAKLVIVMANVIANTVRVMIPYISSGNNYTYPVGVGLPTPPGNILFTWTDGHTVEYWHNSDAASMMNSNGVTYRWIAIG